MILQVVDPTKLRANDLTGMERVSVINKNTGEKVICTYIHMFIHTYTHTDTHT